MRVIDVPEKADILVSELLGSFGDNELSPECLDGAVRFLKRTRIEFLRVYIRLLLIFFLNRSHRNIYPIILFCSSRTSLVLQTI